MIRTGVPGGWASAAPAGPGPVTVSASAATSAAIIAYGMDLSGIDGVLSYPNCTPYPN